MLKKYLTPEKEILWHKLVNPAQNIVIVGHQGPDGDAMGSTLAMQHYLLSLGKKATVLMPTPFPDFLSWLPGSENVVIAQYQEGHANKLLDEADFVMFLDFSSTGRTDELETKLNLCKAPRIILDHHLSPNLSSELMVSDPSACSASEIVFTVLSQLGAYENMSLECAQCVYCGMMTDTGGFTFNSTRPEIFLIISELLAKGIDKDKIYRNVFHNYSVERTRLVGYILNEKMVYFPEYHAAYYTLTREEMERFKFKKGDAEGIVNMPLEIKGTKLSISLREDTEKPLVRVSLRSVDDFPCNKMSADFFNGGGHLNASGGTVYGTIEEAVEQARKAIEAYGALLKDNKC